MGNEYSRQELEEMRAELECLPIGYISRKKISGKEYFYRQWAEDGKTKSQYIKKKDLETIRAQIARRKEIQEILKEVMGKQNLQTGNSREVCSESFFEFETDVQTGALLERLLSGVRNEPERYPVRDLESYLHRSKSDRLCFLFGLRRTGKTTMIYHAINRLTEKEKLRTAYIHVNNQTESRKLLKDIKKLAEMEYRYLFLDELTASRDFMAVIETLSDVYVKAGMKIVISGMNLPERWELLPGSLFDRAVVINTNHISYREYSRLIRTASPESYIHSGGMLQPDNFHRLEEDMAQKMEYMSEFMEYMICGNLGKEQSDILYETVYAWNEERVVSLLAHDFKLYDWKTAVRKKRPRVCEITDIDRNHVIRYLKDLNLYEVYLLWGGENGDELPGCFTMPWVNFLQVRQILEMAMQDSYFAGLSEREKKLVYERMLSDAEKDMLVEILVIETQSAKKNGYKVCRLDRHQSCDMVVYDTHSDECWIYMLCDGDKTDMECEKQMIRDENRRLIERQFGRIIDRCILYSGEEGWTENGIHYQNTGSYLSGLERKNIV
jgi:DNA replication protein DnaC